MRPSSIGSRAQALQTKPPRVPGAARLPAGGGARASPAHPVPVRAVAPRLGALPRALAPRTLRRVAGRVRRRRVPVSGHVVAGITGGLWESDADAGDPT
jgi:hypothetical protein